MPERPLVGATAILLLERAREGGGSLIHVAASEGRARGIARFLAALSSDHDVAVLPPWDCLPYDRALPSPEVTGQRMAVLDRLSSGGLRRFIVVTTPDALLQRVPPPRSVTSVDLRRGEDIDLDHLRAFCRSGGYVEDERVDEPGEVAFRGGVVDIFPAGRLTPCRVEIRDGRITSIRPYDPVTQRTNGGAESLRLVPSSELRECDGSDAGTGLDHAETEGLSSLFDYIGDATITSEPGAEDRREAMSTQIREAYEDRRKMAAAPPPPERLYVGENEWKERMIARAELLQSDSRFRPAPEFALEALPAASFAAFLRRQALENDRVLLVAPDEDDLSRLARWAARSVGRQPSPALAWNEVLQGHAGSVATMHAELRQGFLDREHGIAVITSHDVFGSRAGTGPVAAGSGALWESELLELHPGDLVVHLDHGMAILQGLEPIAAADEDGEAIRLEYADGAKLMVPVDEADRIWRYGSDEASVSLDRLHADAWTKRRARLKSALEETAEKIVVSRTTRLAQEAPRCVPPPRDYERFVARFPFAETPDQSRAIRAVLEDLSSGRPMDRLVLGDVGFGKTEVALRAAAATAFSGRQVAFAVPTTVLARQHFETLSRRFAPFGLRVGHLSRLVSKKETDAVKAGLADGGIRIVVGTHALVGKGIAFAELGLLVVDEEQRFGAAHKKKLGALAAGIHRLSLTATPIPRSLQGALAGLQDISPIRTPPSRRRPVRTLSSAYDPVTVCDALHREKRRGGQSFFVVPRIQDIGPIVGELQRLAPDLDVRIAHGELPARTVDETMVDFAAGRGDVLLATSIIESGLDVPRANTMIIHRADLFGMAELHQLRGRVGRAHVQAHCYLTTEPDQELSEAVMRRLGTLQAYDRLGAGMAIALRDLDQRGAGDLSGERQAGHVKLVGLPLFQDFLARAVRERRGGQPQEQRTALQLELSPFIPADYVPEPELRLTLYHRIAHAREAGDVARLGAEIADRFGPPPDRVRHLLAIASIRTTAAALGISRLAAGPQAITLRFHPDREPDQTLAELIENDPDLSWSEGRLLCRRTAADPMARLAILEELLDQMS